jgi:membrane protease YdiL (CAAX protease family)
MKMTSKIKPMSWGLSILFFGIPAAISNFAIYRIMQHLYERNVPVIVNYFVSFVSLMALMLLAALVAYRLEGNAMSIKSLGERFRLSPMQGKDWLWALGLFAFQGITYVGLSATATWLIRNPLFSPPTFLPPDLDPRTQVGLVYTEFLGISLKGNWWLLVPFFVMMFFNIIGEEFWWRGYIFPRQELAFGKWTWLVHGTFWTLFHVFFRWRWLMILPGALALSYVVQRTRNTWTAIVAHALQMSLALIPLILGILGVSG